MESKFEEMGPKEDRNLSWGRSLPVPSVQEMVKKDPESVPERYVKDHENRPNESTVCFDSSDIPIIDLSLLIDGDREELNKLDTAFKNWGFFQIINHGVQEEILRDMKVAVASFFNLSLEERKKNSRPEYDFHGYGQAYVVSEEQKLEWGDMIFLKTSPLEDRNMKYWPTSVPGFKEAVEKYSEEIERVTEDIMANLSVLMGLEKNGLKKVHAGAKQSMRMNYYPSCSRPELVLGVSPHSDVGSITILLQDDDIAGLQIRHDGVWLSVRPIPGALVVNIGDVIQAWSNGVYKSIEHRAVTNVARARMSIATFVMPHEEIVVGPLPEAMSKDRPKMYRDIGYLDYIRHTLGMKMDGKTHTDFLKLQT